MAIMRKMSLIRSAVTAKEHFKVCQFFSSFPLNENNVALKLNDDIFSIIAFKSRMRFVLTPAYNPNQSMSRII